MSREIRRVPPNWEHPRHTADTATSARYIGEYVPLIDRDYETAARKWIAAFDQWRAGTHPHQSDCCRYYWEYDTPPDPDYCRPAFDAEPTWYQVYETVSEGTPTTPPFATPEELVDYLVNVGERAGTKYECKHSQEAAEAFVKAGWAPLAWIYDGTMKVGIECAI